jgi:hypothetical protein
VVRHGVGVVYGLRFIFPSGSRTSRSLACDTSRKSCSTVMATHASLGTAFTEDKVGTLPTFFDLKLRAKKTRSTRP